VLAEAFDLVTPTASVLEDPLALEERLVEATFPVALLVIDFDLHEAFESLPIAEPCLSSALDFDCLPLSMLVLDSSNPLPRFLLEPALSLSGV
jgi:hypothetical protein